jgi:hypothetical protein
MNTQKILRLLFIAALAFASVSAVVLMNIPLFTQNTPEYPNEPNVIESDPDPGTVPTEKYTRDNTYEKVPDNNSTERSGTNPKYHSPDEKWFVDVTREVGLYNATQNAPGVISSSLPVEGEGSSIYVSDYDRDLDPDILLLRGGNPSLYENANGVYRKSNDLPDIETTVTAAHFLDFDNDGWDELYLMSNEESLFLENQDGKFVRRYVGLNVSYESVRGAATADYTGNGCLDIFAVQSGNWSNKRPSGYNDYNTSISEDNGNKNRLFRGDCETFEETTNTSGIVGETWSLATSFVDLTNNGYPDIHVANDYNNDVVYINNGDGTFDRRILPDFTNRNGMSSEVADINSDGYLDIFVSNIHRMGSFGVRSGKRVRGNNLMLNRGNGSFIDAAEEYGVKRGGWGWAALIEDFDNSGSYDLYQSNSLVLIGRYPNFWKGTEDGFRRMNSSKMGFTKSDHLGAVSLDYDRDGYLEIATSSITRRPRLYNNKLSDSSWLSIRLNDNENTTIGSRVHVVTDGNKRTRVKTSGSDYFSQSTRLSHFGLGEEREADRIRIDWSDGSITTYEDVDLPARMVVNNSRVLRVGR